MIKRDVVSGSSRWAFGWLAASILVILTGQFVSGAQAQQNDDALQILKAMTDYVSNQKTIAATYDTDIEVVTDNLQKIQFASSGQMLLSRPDKVRASRIGGYADVEMVFDGKSLTVLGKNRNKYAEMRFCWFDRSTRRSTAKSIRYGDSGRRPDAVPFI